jgi:hypothetical protein
MQQMIEASFTPAHISSIETPPNGPFAGIFHHTTDNKQT